LPSGLASTGWPAVRDKCAELGIRFDPWQDGAGRIILGKRSSGAYAASVGGVVMSIPRQVGKTFLLGAIAFALCLLFPNLTVIWTAHRLRTAAETFSSMQMLAKRRKVAPHVEKIVLGSGDEEIRFRNGSRILFGARERGFGRGFSEVDVLVFDEAQILTENAIDDMVPAMNQAVNPLLLFTGTPPKPTDPGEVFRSKRDKALSGKSDDMAYLEFSADPDADPDDRAQWARANPSYPRRTPSTAVLRMRENLTDDSFMREAMGIWDTVGGHAVIPFGLWTDAGDEFSVAVDRFALGVEAGPDLRWASVSLAGQRADGSWHIELDEHRDGSDWVVPYVKALLAANPQIRAVIADAGSPTKALLPDFVSAKLHVTCPKVTEIGAACSKVLEGVVTGSVRHPRQVQMSSAVSIAGKRRLGDTGMWVFSRATASSDITPIQSATLALWGAQAAKVQKPSRSGKPRRGTVL
jgi:hypothetical protein